MTARKAVRVFENCYQTNFTRLFQPSRVLYRINPDDDQDQAYVEFEVCITSTPYSYGHRYTPKSQPHGVWIKIMRRARASAFHCEAFEHRTRVLCLRVCNHLHDHTVLVCWKCRRTDDLPRTAAPEGDLSSNPSCVPPIYAAGGWIVWWVPRQRRPPGLWHPSSL